MWKFLICALVYVQSKVVLSENEGELVIPSTSEAFFAETFQEMTEIDGKTWLKSTFEKYSSQSVSIKKATEAIGHLQDDQSIVLEKPASHYGIAAKLKKPFVLNDSRKAKKELVIQYEVKLNEGLTCGGAYIKLLRHDPKLDLTSFNDKTPFVVMFGPDKCGETNKVHFIFQHQNPKTKEYEEKHLQNAPTAHVDRLTHLYTLVVREDNSYELFVDQESKSKGSLFENFSPAVNPPKEIDDPSDKKPEDWVDEAKIADPSAKKPEDWDENAPKMILDEEAVKPADWLDNEPDMIPDPKAPKPEDWDDEEDGEWEAPTIPNPKCQQVSGCGKWKRPMISNPAYRGKWVAPLIDNPAYKGEWKPRQIPNPNYFEDKNPANLSPIGAVAIEVWTMSGGIGFDNFWLGHDLDQAIEFGKQTWGIKHEMETKKIEEERKKDAEKQRETQLEAGGWKDRLAVFYKDLVQSVEQNPLYGVGMVAVALLALFFSLRLCFVARDTIPEAYIKKVDEETEDDAATEEVSEVTEENENETTTQEDEETEESSTSQIRQRKKTPKAE